ncbi:MAG: OB-fold domain-containing protein [Variovorax sp.]
MTAETIDYMGMQLDVNPADANNFQYFSYCGRNELRLQACRACGLLRHPPTSACPWCTCREVEWKPVSGKGTIYSYTIVHHAIQPAFAARVPYSVVLVELDEQRDTPEAGQSLRIVGNLVDGDGTLVRWTDGDAWSIGSRLELTFRQITPQLAVPQWRLASDEAG